MVCTSIYTHRDAHGPFFILLRPVCFVTQVQLAADSLVPLLGACSAVLVNLALVFLRGVSAMLDTTSSSSCEDPSDLLLCPLQTPS